MLILQKRLGYFFSNLKLLKSALTHCSYNNKNNERLEFLGDSILNLIITFFLFNYFKEKDEGSLSYFRAYLVNKKILNKLAKNIKLSDFLFLGQGEKKMHNNFRTSILANALEALLAAIFLDSDFLSVKRIITFLYKPILKDIDFKNFHKDPKTLLQEYLQSKKFSLPLYNVINKTEVFYNQEFEIECLIPVLKIRTFGKGYNKREAEQNAARLALKKIN